MGGTGAAILYSGQTKLCHLCMISGTNLESTPKTSSIQISTMANASQLYLLADHIKLSLLERQRAISLNLEPNAQDGNISRSLESMREGIEALEQDPSPSEELQAKPFLCSM